MIGTVDKLNDNKRYLLESILGIISPLGILQLGSFSLFIIFGMLYVIYGVLNNKKIRFSFNRNFIAYFICLSFSTIFAVTRSIENDWTKRAVKGYITITIVLCIYITLLSGNDYRNKLKSYLYGIKISCFINVIWSIFQFVLFNILKFDLNTTLFVDILHIANSGSKFRGGNICCSGFHWHPGNLAPLLVFGYLRTQNKWYKALIVFVGIFTFQVTVILGVLLCLGYDLFKYVTHSRFYFNRKKFFLGIFEALVIIVALIIMNKTDLTNGAASILRYFIKKITFQGIDNSSKVHLNYYQMLPDIIRSMSFVQILFGFGYGCSGYFYTLFLGQYSNLETWAVESDYINNFLGTGLFASFAILFWIVSIGIKGRKIDYRYFVFICILLVESFGYNIQFDWLILLLCVFSICIKKQLNAFENSESNII